MFLLHLAACGRVSESSVSNQETVGDFSQISSEMASTVVDLQEGVLPNGNIMSTEAKPGTYQTISTDGMSYFVVKNDNSLWAWGKNSSGQLGIGTTIDLLDAVLVMENVAAVDTNSGLTLILKTDGTLWACGRNYRLGIGLADEGIQATPIYIMDDVISVCAGSCTSFVIKSDNSLWAWGENFAGQLGNGTINGVTEPQQLSPVKVLEDVSSVFADTGCTLAIKTDGTLWGWGMRFYDEILPEDSTVPVQIMNDVENVAAVSVSNGYAGIVKTDGTLWVWGHYVSFNYPDTPMPICIMNDVAAISTELMGINILKNDGTLWRYSSPQFLYSTFDGVWKWKVWDGIEEPKNQIKNIVAIDGGVSMIVESDGTFFGVRSNSSIDNIFGVGGGSSIDNIKIP